MNGGNPTTSVAYDRKHFPASGWRQCAVCKYQPGKGDKVTFREVGDDLVCEECFNDLPKCAECGGSGVETDENGCQHDDVCEDCDGTGRNYE